MSCVATSPLFPTERSTPPARKSIVPPCIDPSLPEYIRELKKQQKVNNFFGEVSKSGDGSRGATHPCAEEGNEV
jgi:hypothetical protein